jgi:hypothetical protein
MSVDSLAALDAGAGGGRNEAVAQSRLPNHSAMPHAPPLLPCSAAYLASAAAAELQR